MGAFDQGTSHRPWTIRKSNLSFQTTVLGTIQILDNQDFDPFGPNPVCNQTLLIKANNFHLVITNGVRLRVYKNKYGFHSKKVTHLKF